MLSDVLESQKLEGNKTKKLSKKDSPKVPSKVRYVGKKDLSESFNIKLREMKKLRKKN